MMLVRVKKQDVISDTLTEPGGLELCLDCWKHWMLSDDRDLSASRMRLHGGAEDKDNNPKGFDRDVYAEQRVADHRIGEAADAEIEDMKAAYGWAIKKKYGIASVWNFPQLDWIVVLQQALEELERKLRKNIATAHLF